MITAGSIGILLGSVAIIVKVFSLRTEEHPETALSPLKVAGTTTSMGEEHLTSSGNDVEITTIRTEFLEKISGPPPGNTNLQDLVITPPIPSLSNLSRGEVSYSTLKM